MGQQDVMKILEEKKRFMSNKEIAKELSLSSNRVSASTRRLYLFGEVDRKEKKNVAYGSHYVYKYKDDSDVGVNRLKLCPKPRDNPNKRRNRNRKILFR